MQILQWIIIFILSTAVVLFAVNRISWSVFFAILVLFSIFTIFLYSWDGDNIEGSISSSLYPPPPHLGLDGVSLIAKASH